MISSLKIKLNQIVAENFGGIGMCLWCWQKDFDEQDLMELFGKGLDSECDRH
jgi:hypothetical protein